MKAKKLFIFNLLLFVFFICCFNIYSKAETKKYKTENPIYDLDFYEGDYYILDKGYYLIVGDGDLSAIQMKGSCQMYYHTGDITSDNFKKNITVEQGYESGIDEIIKNFNSSPDVWGMGYESIMLRVDNYARLLYGEGGGCLLFSFGIVIEQGSNERYHVIDYDNKLAINDIINKYSFSDNVDSKENLSVFTETPYSQTSYPGYYFFYVEVTDTSGNVATTKDYIYVHDYVAPTINSKTDNYEFEVHTSTLTSKDILDTLEVSDNATSFELLNKEIIDTFESQYDIVGNYSITYKATDAQGNSTTKVISIKVKDSTPPIISLKDGGNAIYTDHDLTNEEIYELLEISDNYDEISYDQVEIISTSQGLEGVEYQVTVSVTDSNNNYNTATYTYYINDTTPPNITVRDTVYLDRNKTYSTEEIIAILKNANIISSDAISVNILSEELLSSSKDEDVYTLYFEQVLSDGTIECKQVTLKYQKQNTNTTLYIIIGSCILISTGIIIFIIRRKKKKYANK